MSKNADDLFASGDGIAALTAGDAVAQDNPLFSSQWYLSGVPFSPGLTSVQGIDVNSVWPEYDGSGVRIGIIDNFFDVDQSDLQGRFDLGDSYDPQDPSGAINILPDTVAETHGTAVASVIGAGADDGAGMVGVAYGATLVGYVTRLYSTAANARVELTDLLSRQVAVDVSNNSWGFTAEFSDNFELWTWASYAAAFQLDASQGRGGLGTVLVFAAGNDRQFIANDPSHDGDNTNYHNTTNSPFEITVAATDESGHVTGFSTPGASVFVAAPGQYILTDGVSSSGDMAAAAYTFANGTSLAAPIVTGVVALMLEANADLGYRDVQDILAASSLRVDPTTDSWITNGATTWNGGGYLVNSDVGFGLIDAHAAVRLAETWTAVQTFANEAAIDVTGVVPNGGILTDYVPLALAFSPTLPAEHFQLQWVTVDVDITHSFIGDLHISLISPDGTNSVLMDQPADGTNNRANLQFTFSSDQFWGEDVQGTWQLVVTDDGPNGTGHVNGFTVHFYGTESDDSVYVFTDQFAALAGPRDHISDAAGNDTINASAVTTGSQIDLAPGSTSIIAGRPVTIDAGTTIENAFGGDGNDVIVGNTADNSISGGRGDDTLSGGGGNDRIDGGDGNDTAVFSGHEADYGFFVDGSSIVVVDNRAGAPDGTEHLVSVENLKFADGELTAESLLATGLSTYAPPPAPDDTSSSDANSGGGTQQQPAPDGADAGDSSSGSQQSDNTENGEQSAPSNSDAGPSSGTGTQPTSGHSGDGLSTHAASFDGHPYDDVILEISSTHALVFADMEAGTNVGFGTLTGSISDLGLVGHADMNGDGIADLLVQDPGSANLYVDYQDGLGDGAANWAVLSSALKGDGFALEVVGVADINGDGSPDVLLQSEGPNGNGVVFALTEQNGGAPTFAAITPALQGNGVDLHVVGVGDVNGDGFADLVLQGQSGGGQVMVDDLHNNIFETIASATGGFQVVGVGDVNGDGHADIVLQQPNGGDVIYLDPTGGMNDFKWGVETSGTSLVAKGVADVDNDGIAEILFQDTSNGSVAYRHVGATDADGFWGAITGANGDAFHLM